MGRRIWGGVKVTCRFCDRAFIWYVRFCLGVWVGIWLAESYRWGRVLSFDEVQRLLDNWAR
jgi:hypothetical protein